MRARLKGFVRGRKWSAARVYGGAPRRRGAVRHGEFERFSESESASRGGGAQGCTKSDS